MSQWAEIRHLHLVEKVPKKEIARRLKLNVKTVRDVVDRPTPPVRVSPARASGLDPWREQIMQWLREDRRTTAKRIRRLLLPLAGPISPRTVRRYVAVLRAAVTSKSKEAFVHRSVLPGTTMEVDFGESWADIAGAPCKVKYLVATLPYSCASRLVSALTPARRRPRRSGCRGRSAWSSDRRWHRPASATSELPCATVLSRRTRSAASASRRGHWRAGRVPTRPVCPTGRQPAR